jgi:hypothetical protein
MILGILDDQKCNKRYSIIFLGLKAGITFAYQTPATSCRMIRAQKSRAE